MNAEHFKKPWSLKSTNFGESMGYDSLTVIVDAKGAVIAELGSGTIKHRAREERAAREIVDAINASGTNADACRAPLCDCSMGATERCGRPSGAADPARNTSGADS